MRLLEVRNASETETPATGRRLELPAPDRDIVDILFEASSKRFGFPK
jgi:hypothetical protein